MKTYRKIILSVLIAAAAMLSGALGWPAQFLIAGALYFVGAFLFIDNKIKKIYSALLLIAPFFLTYDIFIFFIHTHGYNVYPIAIIPILNTILGAVAKQLYLKQNRKRIATLLSFLYIVVFISAGYIFVYNWVDSMLCKDIDINQNCNIADINLYNLSGEKIDIDTLQNKVIVLNCWASFCGACFRDFPDFEKIQNHFKGQEVVFYAVYIPFADDYEQYMEQGVDYIKEQQFSFPVLRTDRTSVENLEITAVPQMIIINKNKKTVYANGTGYKYKKFVRGNFYATIDELLKE